MPCTNKTARHINQHKYTNCAKFMYFYLMKRTLILLITLTMFLSSCVVHFKEIGQVFSDPKQFICFSHICVRQAYGINKINQLKNSREIKKRKRNYKKHKGNKESNDNVVSSKDSDTTITKKDSSNIYYRLTLSDIDTTIHIIFINDSIIKFNQDSLLKYINIIGKEKIEKIEIQSYYTKLNKTSIKNLNRQRMNEIYTYLNNNGMPAYIMRINIQEETNLLIKRNLVELYITRKRIKDK